jgi:hypothetical protein
MKQFEPLKGSDSVDCFFYRPQNSVADLKSCFEYSSVPLFLQTQTVCESKQQTRVVGEFIDDFKDFFSAVENHGDPIFGESEAKVLLRFLIHSFPLKNEYQTPSMLKIAQEHTKCLEELRMSIGIAPFLKYAQKAHLICRFLENCCTLTFRIILYPMSAH